MDITLLILRVVHVVCGVFWAGSILFVAHFLEPAVRAAGPDGAKVMSGLQKRRYLDVVPAMALLTLVSGFWLYGRDFGRVHPGPGASAVEWSLGVGGFLSLVAFAIGVTLLRPAALRLGRLGAEMAGATPERRDALAGEMARLQSRLRVSGRAVAALLGLVIVSMAIARYL